MIFERAIILNPMKMKKIIAFLGIALIAVSCEKASVVKSTVNNEDLKGIWISEFTGDTITFQNDSIFTRSTFDIVPLFYRYWIQNDSITIKYKGTLKIFWPTLTYSFTLRDKILTINFTKQMFGFDKIKETFDKL